MTTRTSPQRPPAHRSLRIGIAVGAIGLLVAGVATAAEAATAPDAGPAAGGTSVIVDLPGFTQVDQGFQHSVAVASDGTVWAWGLNPEGRLGDGTSNDSALPVQVDGTAWGPRTITDVSAGRAHSLALASDGTVWSWGQGNSGELGTGNLARALAPAQVTPGWGSRTITAILAGDYFSVALASDGTVWSWGQGAFGALGSGGTDNLTAPTQVLTDWGSRSIIELAAGTNHVLALASDGTVWAWGTSDEGQLGDGSDTDSMTSRPVPAQVETTWGARTIVSIGAGVFHSLAVASDGSVWAWGYNINSQLGIGSTTNAAVPTAVDSSAWGTRTIVRVDGGLAHSVALASDGTVWAWGNNYAGQLGDGTNTTSAIPVRVVEPELGSSRVVDVDAGDWYFSGALTDAGTFWAWGYNSEGQLGTGGGANVNAPVHSGWTPTTVSFGGVEATDFVDLGDGTASVITPAHVAGTVDVVVGTRFEDMTTGPSFTAAQAFTFVAPPVIGTADLPAGQVGDSYETQLEASGVGPLTWSVAEGALPDGLTLDPVTGVISGTPTVDGTFTFTVGVTNAGGTTTHEVTITVKAAPVVMHPRPGDERLADTGVELLPTAVVAGAALLLLLSGAVLALRTTRRRG